VGIIRGGLVPARVLSDLLEVPMVATIQVEFYVNIGKTAAEPVLKQGLAVPVAGKRVLLVDDIADSGKSLQLALNYLQGQGAAEIKSATLYYKRKSVIQPSFFEKETDCWVVFPWETRETLREILNSHKGKRDANHAVAKLVKSGLPQHLADTLLASMQEQT
jgi:hypoxanthine phosphoribosyltransferase